MYASHVCLFIYFFWYFNMSQYVTHCMPVTFVQYRDCPFVAQINWIRFCLCVTLGVQKVEWKLSRARIDCFFFSSSCTNTDKDKNANPNKNFDRPQNKEDRNNRRNRDGGERQQNGPMGEFNNREDRPRRQGQGQGGRDGGDKPRFDRRGKREFDRWVIGCLMLVVFNACV